MSAMGTWTTRRPVLSSSAARAAPGEPPFPAHGRDGVKGRVCAVGGVGAGGGDLEGVNLGLVVARRHESGEDGVLLGRGGRGPGLAAVRPAPAAGALAFVAAPAVAPPGAGVGGAHRPAGLVVRRRVPSRCSGRRHRGPSRRSCPVMPRSVAVPRSCRRSEAPRSVACASFGGAARCVARRVRALPNVKRITS